MAVRTLCFSFVVVVVAIEQSLADFNSSNVNLPEYNYSPIDVQLSPNSPIPRDIGNSMGNRYEGNVSPLIVNNGKLTVKKSLGDAFDVPCTVLDPTETEYEPRWRMKDDSPETFETKLGPIPGGKRMWLKGAILEFKHLDLANAGYWTCELWSLTQNKMVESASVKVSVDPDSWAIQLEDPLEEYLIKKDTSVTCILIIKNAKSIEGFHIDWYWPSGKIIDRRLMPPLTIAFPEERMVKQFYVLRRVPVGGTYRVKVSKNGKFQMLTANVWVCSNTSSSVIRIQSSVLALAAVCFACRSVALGTTA